MSDIQGKYLKQMEALGPSARVAVEAHAAFKNEMGQVDKTIQRAQQDLEGRKK